MTLLPNVNGYIDCMVLIRSASIRNFPLDTHAFNVLHNAHGTHSHRIAGAATQTRAPAVLRWLSEIVREVSQIAGAGAVLVIVTPLLCTLAAGEQSSKRT